MVRRWRCGWVCRSQTRQLKSINSDEKLLFQWGKVSSGSVRWILPFLLPAAQTQGTAAADGSLALLCLTISS